MNENDLTYNTQSTDIFFCLFQVPKQATEEVLRIDLIGDVYKKDINFLFSLGDMLSVGSCYIKCTKCLLYLMMQLQYTCNSPDPEVQLVNWTSGSQIIIGLFSLILTHHVAEIHHSSLL